MRGMLEMQEQNLVIPGRVKGAPPFGLTTFLSSLCKKIQGYIDHQKNDEQILRIQKRAKALRN